MRKKIGTGKKYGVAKNRARLRKSLKSMGRSRIYFFVESPRERVIEKSVAKLLSSMQMKDMLEASEAIKANQYKIEPLMEVTSEKALKYADYVSRFEKEPRTRNTANRLMGMLNDRILEINAKSIDMEAAEKVYNTFMGVGTVR